MKKISFFTVLLSVIILLSGCGMSAEQIADLIGEESSETVVQPVDSLNIAYTSKLPLDPFQQSSGQNEQIAKLVFEPLFAMDEELRTYGLLAQGVEKVTDTEYRIALNSTRVFWDGSAIQVSDVLTSYEKAKKSKNYATLLSGITAMREEGGKIVVSISSPDVYFMNNLSFPIIKASSDTPVVTDEKNPQKTDSLKFNYIGTGLYVPKFGDTVTLQLNSRHPRAAKATVKTIALVDMPDFEAMSYSLDAGVVDMIYSDLSGGLSPVISGNLRAVSQNHLVYLGVSSTGATSDWQVRKAISLALNRTTLVAYYSGYAKEATTPFHPAWYGAAGKANANLTFQQNAAKELVNTLKAAGLNSSLTLAVNKDNNIRVRMANEIAGQLNQVGFTCTVSQLDFSAYTSAVQYGGYNLYIGELSMPNNFNLSYLLKSGHKSFGIIASDGLMTNLNSFYQTGDPTAFLTSFNDELPFIPLCYRSGMAGFSASFKVPAQTTFDFAFSDIEQTNKTVTQTASSGDTSLPEENPSVSVSSGSPASSPAS